jgi:RING-box protein 1
METAVAKRFEVKKWNAVALWAWGKPHLKYHPFSLDIHVDNCAICRNHIMDPCKEKIIFGNNKN